MQCIVVFSQAARLASRRKWHPTARHEFHFRLTEKLNYGTLISELQLFQTCIKDRSKYMQILIYNQGSPLMCNSRKYDKVSRRRRVRVGMLKCQWFAGQYRCATLSSKSRPSLNLCATYNAKGFNALQNSKNRCGEVEG